MDKDAIFISTSIPYVNGAPHVGFAWELVLADVLARYHRACGRRVWFCTGTDDNSLKNVRAAEALGQPTAAFVRGCGERFEALCRGLGLSNDDFLRTAFDARHAPAVEAIWRACAASGDIYTRSYQGAYCVGCEQFYASYELAGSRCPEHDAELERIDEQNAFFRLSRHQAGIDALLTDGTLRIWPDVYRAESYGWVRAGLADFSVSRSTERARGWGIAVPGDPGQIVYVWFDALVNYISSLGYGTDPSRFGAGWQQAARRIHVIGKNVTRFHCVYWPGILASAGLRPPSDVVVHGFLTVDGRKIGKSLGNGVDPFGLLERFGAERLRHYLLARFPLGGDGDVSIAGLVHASNDALADQLGNLQNRLLVLLDQNTDGNVPAEADGELEPLARSAAARASAELERCDPHAAIGEVFGFIRAINLALARSEPWRLARRLRDEPDTAASDAGRRRLRAILGDAARALLWAAGLLEPFLPETAARIARAFATPLPRVYAGGGPAWRDLAGAAPVQRGPVLFERLASDVAAAVRH